jgi:hypothetical protein
VEAARDGALVAESPETFQPLGGRKMAALPEQRKQPIPIPPKSLRAQALYRTMKKERERRERIARRRKL